MNQYHTVPTQAMPPPVTTTATKLGGFPLGIYENLDKGECGMIQLHPRKVFRTWLLLTYLTATNLCQFVLATFQSDIQRNFHTTPQSSCWVVHWAAAQTRKNERKSFILVIMNCNSLRKWFLWEIMGETPSSTIANTQLQVAKSDIVASKWWQPIKRDCGIQWCALPVTLVTPCCVLCSPGIANNLSPYIEESFTDL